MNQSLKWEDVFYWFVFAISSRASSKTSKPRSFRSIETGNGILLCIIEFDRKISIDVYTYTYYINTFISVIFSLLFLSLPNCIDTENKTKRIPIIIFPHFHSHRYSLSFAKPYLAKVKNRTIFTYFCWLLTFYLIVRQKISFDLSWKIKKMEKYVGYFWKACEKLKK